jgi:CheY-like chemotaxis protein
MITVLIAEDEPDAREAYQEIVEGMGHRVLVAGDGEAALHLVQQECPAVLITDHMMPRMTGVELMRALRREPAGEQVPVLLLSAVHPVGRDEAWRFIQKPVTLDDFERAVNEAVAMAMAVDARTH